MSGSQQRPFGMRGTPLWLRERLFYRVYRRRVRDFESLFRRAELALAPGVFMSLSASDVGHQVIALTGVYEASISQRVMALARRGGLMVDVGANYGYYSCLWAAARPENQVIAFEASPHNLTALRANVAQNGFTSQVTIHEQAVGRESGIVGFRLGSAEQTGQGGFSGAHEQSEIQVPVCTLDAALASTTDLRIDVLKIDVEGADTWVLEGADTLLRQKRVRHIFFEQFPDRMEALGGRRGSQISGGARIPCSQLGRRRVVCCSRGLAGLPFRRRSAEPCESRTR